MSSFIVSFKAFVILFIICFALILLLFSLLNIDSATLLSSGNITLNPGRKHHNTRVNKTFDEATYWMNYYQELIDRTHINSSYSPNLQLKEPCKGQFYPDMKNNMKVVLNYPVIKKARKKYKGMFDTFDQRIVAYSRRTHPIIVTGSSSNHYFESLAMIKNFKEKLLPNYPKMKLIVFDLGLRKNEVRKLKGFCSCEIRKFPFKEYPSFASDPKNYIWKPIILYMMLKEFDFVMWADSSVAFNGNKNATVIFFSKAKEVGILANRLNTCDFCLSYYFTKKDTFTLLNEPVCQFGLHQLEPGFVTIFRNSFTWKYIIQPWLACALTKNCISHDNPESIVHLKKHSKTTFHWCHRFDQSAFSIILQRLFNANIDIVSLNRLPSIYRLDRDQKFHLS